MNGPQVKPVSNNLNPFFTPKLNVQIFSEHSLSYAPLMVMFVQTWNQRPPTELLCIKALKSSKFKAKRLSNVIPLINIRASQIGNQAAPSSFIQSQSYFRNRKVNKISECIYAFELVLDKPRLLNTLSKSDLT